MSPAVPPPLQALMHLPRVSAFPLRRTWPPAQWYPCPTAQLNSAARLPGTRWRCSSGSAGWGAPEPLHFQSPPGMSL